MANNALWYLCCFHQSLQGKTEQARADLARLAIIKQHRAEAAARREAEKKGNFPLLD